MAMELLSAAQVAALKGVSEATVYRAVREGRLRSVHVLGRVGVEPGAAQVWQPSTHGGKRPGGGRKRKDAAAPTSKG